MDSRKFVLKETAAVTIGQIVCSTAMVGIFALLGYFDRSVVLGALFGSLLAIGNFFFLAIAANMAADRAEAQDVEGGQKIMRSSYPLRMLVLLVLLVLLAKSGICNIIALAVPLLFTRPVLSIYEFFRKKEG